VAEKTRAVGYVRVSTGGQVNGFGLDVQESTVRRYARERAFRLVGIVREEGISGTADITERAGLAEALRRVRDDEADVLLVPSLDRLARELTVQEATLAAVWRAGGRVFAADSGEVPRDDPDDPMRTFVRHVLGAVSQLERGMIAARLRRGRRLKRERGGYAGGRPRYGYSAESGELVPNHAEQEVLAVAHELRRNGLSYRSIARELAARGHYTRKGGAWHPWQLAELLSRKRGV
jgi:DNA invertase Pin-like site-specific DNA recombinase